MKKIIAAVIAVGLILVGYRMLVKTEEIIEIPSIGPEVNKIISYTDNGYSPNSVKAGLGSTFVFKNDSSSGMWTASAKHPTHSIYPTTGGCIGSTFDACKSIPPGGSWTFEFNKIGAWKYHNHLNPSHFGEIIIVIE